MLVWKSLQMTFLRHLLKLYIVLVPLPVCNLHFKKLKGIY
jgi:hypothetical protein